jgi:hypothetical protein
VFAGKVALTSYLDTQGNVRSEVFVYRRWQIRRIRHDLNTSMQISITIMHIYIYIYAHYGLLTSNIYILLGFVYMQACFGSDLTDVFFGLSTHGKIRVVCGNDGEMEKRIVL